MKPRLPALPALLTCLSLAFLPAHSALATGEHDHHQPGEKAPPALKLNAGKKWETDAALRQTMGEINRAMNVAVPQIHENRFGEAEYRGLAETIRLKVAYAVEHCRLEPKADAMLHLVIADLLAGAETMAGPEANARHDGAVQVVKALRNYGSYFRHPGWKRVGG